MATKDAINPSHYQSKGLECIDYSRHMNFCVGNAFKYIWRAGQKDDIIQELTKALWYLNDHNSIRSMPIASKAHLPIPALAKVFKGHQKDALEAIIRGELILAVQLINRWIMELREKEG